MKCESIILLFVVMAIAVMTSCRVVAQQNASMKNPLAVPTVALDKYGLFTVEDCPTTHDLLEVTLHEGEYCIDRVEIFTDGIRMQSLPIREDDSIVRKVVHFLDANFDGVFDAKDKPFSRFRYGVLISAYSFSGGNAFPFFMRENGAMILGQRSGGGACGIRISTAGGVEISFSDAGTRIVDKNGESVDTGCPVDAELYRAPENEESSGYELFYDLAALSDAMNAFFDAAELEPAA